MSTVHPVREFFRTSPRVLDFVNHACVGTRPWAIVVDAADRIVMIGPDRDEFFLVAKEGDEFVASSTYDAIQVIDPESEDLDRIGSAPTVAAAFEQAIHVANGLGLGLPEAVEATP